MNEPRIWSAILETVEENDDGSIHWAEGCISTHGGGNICWDTEAIEFVEKKDFDRLRKQFEDLVKTCEWYADNGLEQERHHFLAVEARGNYLDLAFRTEDK